MTDIQNIGTTTNQTQLVIHVTHDGEGGASVYGMVNQKPCNAVILFANTEIMSDDQTIAQVMISLTNCDPDTIDVQHIGRHHETD